MSGKVQVIVLSLGLMLSGPGVNRAVSSAARNPQVLYVLAQYKLFTGQTEAASELLRKAAAAEQTAAGKKHTAASSSPDAHKG